VLSTCPQLILHSTPAGTGTPTSRPRGKCLSRYATKSICVGDKFLAWRTDRHRQTHGD